MSKRKKVFITGGTGSVGEVLVRSFVNENYAVEFQYFSNTLKAKNLEKACSVKSYKIDFNNFFELPDVKYDIVINNSGINECSDLVHEVPDTILKKTIQINLVAPFNICKKFLPHMVANKWGRIININSIYGLRGTENNSPYNVSKHALSGLTKSIAKEYARYGITCNEICPSAIESDMMTRIANEEELKGTVKAGKYLEMVRTEIPAQRMANAQDIASIAIFLASEKASFITGTSIPVDGGLIC